MVVTVTQMRERNCQEMRLIIGALRRKSEPQKTAWWRLANVLGITQSQVHRLYHLLWKDPPGSVIETVRRNAFEHLAGDDFDELAEEFGDLIARIHDARERNNAANLLLNRPACDSVGSGHGRNEPYDRDRS